MKVRKNSVWACLVGALLVVLFACPVLAFDCPTSYYEQSGLVACWDGIDNVASGEHDAAATVWRDRVAGYEFSLSNVTIGDRYLGFNGSNAYGQLATGATAAFPSGVKTVEIVIKLETAEGIAMHGPTASGVSFGPYKGNILINNKENGFGYSGPGTTVTNVYATIYGSDSMPSKLNLNGASVSSANANNYWGSPDDGKAWLGKRSNGQYFNGKIFAIRVYNRALSADEIDHNYAVDRYRFFDDDSKFTPDPYSFSVLPIPEQSCVFGQACEPTLVVTNISLGCLLVPGTDYTVTYENNTSIGTATAIVTGLGDYADKTKNKSFRIRASRLGISDAYVPVDYIQGNGVDTRFVTDVTPVSNTDSVETEFALTSTGWTGALWCSRGGNSTSATWTLYAIGNAGLRFDYNSNASAGTFGADVKPGVKYTLAVTNSAVTWSGGAGYSYSPASFTAGNKLALFASYYNGLEKNNGNYSTHRLYSFVYRRNGAILREYIPCYRASDLAVGLYDAETDTFLASSGKLPSAKGDANTANFRIEPLTEPVLATGAAIEPNVVVRDKTTGAKLTAGTDYEVVYANNTGAGRGIVRVTGLGDYAGTDFTTFTIRKVYFAAHDGSASADGASWATPMTIDAAVAAAAATNTANGTEAEVWIKSGAAARAATLTVSRPMAIRGGFLGASGTSDALDTANPETEFDGNPLLGDSNPIANHLTITAPALPGQSVTLERLCLNMAHNRALSQETASHLVCRDCRFLNSGLKSTKSNIHGAYVKGTAGVTELRFANCRFEGNCDFNNNIDCGHGFGLYAENCQRVFVDDCQFLTNCWSFSSGRSVGGSAIYATSAPITCRNTSFKGNNFTTHENAAAVLLAGASGGSAFTNCLFAGNAACYKGTYTPPTVGGALCVNYSTSVGTLDVDHCTFAYNLNGSAGYGWDNSVALNCAAGLSVRTGTAKVRNSIFWGNSVSSDTICGADVFVYTGSLDIDYSIVGGLTREYLYAGSGGTLTVGGHVFAQDPLFATSLSDLAAYFKGGSAKLFAPRSTVTSTSQYWSNSAAARAALVAIDCRPRSKTDAGYSPAIDASDPAPGVVKEPAPNGGIANLGYDGNTATAATSLLGVPALADGDVAVTFDRTGTQPSVAFTLGGNDTAFNASALIEIGTGGVWCVSRAFAGLHQGSSVTWDAEFSPASSATVNVRVTVISPGNANIVVTASGSTDHPMAAYVGHGGDSNKVVHVRAGSTALNPGGTSWEDAFPDVWTATAALSETRNEMWIAGDFTLTATPVYFVPRWACTLRGGFDGTEDALADRADNTFTQFDGQNLCTCFRLTTRVAITFERLRFTRGYGRGFYRDYCPGATTFRDCQFTYCQYTDKANSIEGAAFYTAKNKVYGPIAFYGCLFRGNGRANHTSNDAKRVNGGCIYVSEMTSLTVDGCTFEENGITYELGVTNNRNGITGSCIYANITPTTVTNSRFVGNRSSCYKTDVPGGTIYLKGASDGSVVRNCAFVGNECVSCSTTAGNAGTMASAGIIVNYAEAVRLFTLENCTFAWNLSGCKTGAIDLYVNKGTANVKNCIFHGGVLGGGATVPADTYIAASADGSFTTNYCMIAGTPGFVTSALGVEILDAAAVTTRYANDMAKILAADVHLLSKGGYYDNAGTLHADEEVPLSKAIDAGDPTDDYSNEPEPNGGFINLGAYGNTAKASRSVEIKPEILDDAVTVTFPDNTSLPNVAFSLKPGDDYTAMVQVYCGTGALAQAGTAYSTVSPTLSLKPGVPFAWQNVSEPYVAGDTLYVKVVITCGSQVTTKIVSKTIEGNMPAWYGRGGGATVLHVWADAPVETDGSDWQHAFRTLEAAAAAYRSGIAEIWVAGNVTLTNSVAITALAPLAVRGGFTASENLPGERPEGDRSWLEGGFTYNPLVLVNAADCPVTLERIDFANGINHGVHKTGAGDLAAIECAFVTNGTRSTVSPFNGRGLYVSATGARVALTNCLFSYNVLQSCKDAAGNYSSAYGNGVGHGAYFEGCIFVDVVGSTFQWNGYPHLEGNVGQNSGNPQCNAMSGSALYSKVPIALRGCKFLGNSGTPRSTGGGAVRLVDAAAGVVEHCVFAGNFERGIAESSVNGGGALVVNLTNPGDVVTVNRCTFAYNTTDGINCAAGLTVKAGTVDLKNSVFCGNVLGYRALDLGVDLNVQAGATCHASYVLFGGADQASSVSLATGATYDATAVQYGDALLVTAKTNVTAQTLIATASNVKYVYLPDTPASYARMVNIDVHEKSSAGYCTDAGTWLQAEEGVLSPAIDSGDPNDSDWSAEPSPNGGRANCGAYAATVEASKSPEGHPAIDGNVAVTFEDTYSLPTVTFTVGGEGTFTAGAVIQITTNGTDWVYTSGDISGLGIGSVVSQQLPIYLDPSTTVKAKVTLTGAGETAFAESAVTDVTKPMPHWIGHGGDPTKVIHLRPGALASKLDGTSWTDAVTDISDAFALLTETRNEIWLCGTNVIGGSIDRRTISTAFTLRGGFTAYEDTAAERPATGYGVIDGDAKFNPVVIKNTAAAAFERVSFENAYTHNIDKSGAGDAVFNDCRFAYSFGKKSVSGRGGYFVGTSAATVAFTNCVIEGNNTLDFDSNTTGSGIGFYFDTFKHVYIDRCQFVTNGTVIGGGGNGCQSQANGSAIYATAAPTTLTRSKFIGNSLGCSQGSGAVAYFTGNSQGTRIENCLFLGNEEWWQGTYGPLTGTGPVTFSFTYSMYEASVANCTFAYNLAGGTSDNSGIRVLNATVDISGCVFYGAITGTSHSVGAAVHVTGDGSSATIRYSMAESPSDYTVGSGATLVKGEGLLYGDPLLATPRDAFNGRVQSLSGGSYGVYKLCRFYASARPVIGTANGHLRSRAGYVDEVTGQHVTSPHWKLSPAVDAGDPCAAYGREPARNGVGGNGRRVNLGAYANTPYATMTPVRGAFLRVR